MDVQPPPPVKHHDITDFRFQDGTVLATARLAYLDINPGAPSGKVALVPTCFRGKLHTTLSFADGAFRDHRIIVVALFGNGESSSPSNTSAFPGRLDYRDCVRAQHDLLTRGLGLSSGIDVVSGFSMAGQTAYYWAAMYPGFLRSGAVVICSSARTSGHNRQFLEGPRAAIEQAVDYHANTTTSDSAHAASSRESPRAIRAFAKAYSAWLTSAEWFDQECWRELGFDSHEAWDEGSTGPDSGYKGWFADDLLIMLKMWQAGDVSVCSQDGVAKSLEAALGEIEVPVLLMPCETDQYFRPAANERELKSLKKGKLEVIPGVWGHLAGGGTHPASTKWMSEKIEAFLQ
ncbi:Alpha/Beta hydrolase protein [Microdochium bolleyi]|uniref:Alpha/Beta hydrolase protein n=1 Tax=Microdochium bolleyi TaxID=196109 RepID=A0A136IQT4_9PEZI|nr:Alpha/Beta hydrolase protein [Microdochium bolleyi]